MSQLSADFFKPFVDGTLKTLKMSCTMDATPLKPFFKGTQPQAPFEIAGIIALTSQNFNGSITICYTMPLYLKLMSNMLGENYTVFHDDLKDGAAELLNMIFGHAKVVLNQQGHTLQKAIPTVIVGQITSTSHLGSGKVMVLPFTTDAGQFCIEVCTVSTNIS